MSKDPAFLFYPNDWLGGTMGYPFELKGCYIELLIYQFNNGHFSIEEAKQVLSICFDVAWPMLSKKFAKDEKGYYNERLQAEIEKRSRFTESRRANGLKPKKSGEAYAKHMGNENENENDNSNTIIKEPKIKKFAPPTLEQVIQYFHENGYSQSAAAKYFNYYTEGKWVDSKGTKIRNWKQKAQAVWFKEENKITHTSIPMSPR